MRIKTCSISGFVIVAVLVALGLKTAPDVAAIGSGRAAEESFQQMPNIPGVDIGHIIAMHLDVARYAVDGALRSSFLATTYYQPLFLEIYENELGDALPAYQRAITLRERLMEIREYKNTPTDGFMTELREAEDRLAREKELAAHRVAIHMAAINLKFMAEHLRVRKGRESALRMAAEAAKRLGEQGEGNLDETKLYQEVYDFVSREDALDQIPRRYSFDTRNLRIR